jgi:hypothetical protein
MVKQAARLIAGQIRNMEYDNKHCLNQDDISLEGSSIIPSLLQIFIDQLVHDTRKAAGIALANIQAQAARLRGSIMPIIFGSGAIFGMGRIW